jgi:lipopolysaccharide/colanic/teichoic acid biosynthesis glycosyltransferase
MNLIIIHTGTTSATNEGDNLLRLALADPPLSDIILDGLVSTSSYWQDKNKVTFAVPEEWRLGLHKAQRHTNSDSYFYHSGRKIKIVPYKQEVPVHADLLQKTRREPWVAFINGLRATQINKDLLNKVLANTRADVLAINATPSLLAYRERVRLTAEDKVVAFRRLHTDSAEPAQIPRQWPHCTFVRADALGRLFDDRVLPASFSAFLERCRLAKLRISAVKIAGVTFDLETEEGLLNLCMITLSKTANSEYEFRHSNTISQYSRLVGKVLLGANIHIGPNATVIGPSVICNNVSVEENAVISSSIIGPNVCVLRGQIVQSRYIRSNEHDWKHKVSSTTSSPEHLTCSTADLSHRPTDMASFRVWPRFSYVMTFKRIADFVAALIVLILFAPIVPFIALAMRLASPGPIFFRDKRQRLHGKEFYCVKFRTMTVGSDKIQEKLRIASEVDGPQFKIKDDPRISVVGRFLRDTYIDEIPQFFNVLLGHMSVVGPRPSPEAENTLCPSWRDARLSVRPGITGLWQVRRTRQPMKDFQEWIHYDIKYVRELSLRMDLWICWQTAKKMVRNFISQF